MIAAVTLAALGVLVLTAIWIGVRRPANATRMARWIAFGLLAAEAAVLAPATVADSGVAASYLLGVPVLAALLAVVADLTGHAVAAADLIAATVVTVWAILLLLGLGVAFLPPAVLLFAAFAADLSKRRSTIATRQ
jgi:hypothetical protein